MLFRSTSEGDGTLLDHTLLMFGSGMSDGNVHRRTGLPLLVAGGQRLGVKGNRHLMHPAGTPHTNLLLAVADRFDVHLDRIGNSRGRVAL